MKIIFHTNLDHYKTNCFPENLTHKPFIGEKIQVVSVFKSFYENKKLPTRLEVVDVTHTEQGVVCELYYNEQDLHISKIAGGNPF